MIRRHSDAEAEIHRVLEASADALRSKNAKGVVFHFAPEIVSYDLQPPLEFKGHEVLDPGELQSWMDSFTKDIGFERGDTQVLVNGDLAVCFGLAHLTGLKKSGEDVDLWSRQTLVLRKLEGAWKLVHEHHSVPFYMDGSFKAAVDLEPEE